MIKTCADAKFQQFILSVFSWEQLQRYNLYFPNETDSCKISTRDVKKAISDLLIWLFIGSVWFVIPSDGGKSGYPKGRKIFGYIWSILRILRSIGQIQDSPKRPVIDLLVRSVN